MARAGICRRGLVYKETGERDGEDFPARLPQHSRGRRDEAGRLRGKWRPSSHEGFVRRATFRVVRRRRLLAEMNEAWRFLPKPP
jgi:hypothetical protein